MTAMKPWFSRNFSLEIPVELTINQLERLRGAAARLEEKVAQSTPEALTAKNGDAWSVQEHAGHLLDLEALWLFRMGDFTEKVQTMRPADLQNRKTDEADHNARDIKGILAGFRKERQTLISTVEAMTADVRHHVCLHPRLNKGMRVVDLCYFIAEHDDHHLSVIEMLNKGR